MPPEGARDAAIEDSPDAFPSARDATDEVDAGRTEADVLHDARDDVEAREGGDSGEARDAGEPPGDENDSASRIDGDGGSESDAAGTRC